MRIRWDFLDLKIKMSSNFANLIIDRTLYLLPLFVDSF